MKSFKKKTSVLLLINLAHQTPVSLHFTGNPIAVEQTASVLCCSRFNCSRKGNVAVQKTQTISASFNTLYYYY